MKDWIVAIPSYQRAATLCKKTLATLRRGGVAEERVHVFVANAEEHALYAAALARTRTRLIIGAPGIVGVRNAISNYFGEGAQVVEMDDDLTDVSFAQGPKTLVSVEDLGGWFTFSFATAQAAGARLWGTYPVCNPYFMKDKVSYDLRPCIGALHGHFCDPRLQLHADALGKEDIERTLLYYLADGRVARFNGYAAKQNARTEPGGLQAPGGRTHETSQRAAGYLRRTYSALVHMASARKGGHAEVRLRDTRSKATG